MCEPVDAEVAMNESISAEFPPGSGGCKVTPEMLDILRKPGSIKDSEGGKRLRLLYRQCRIGVVEQFVDSGKAPSLTGTETPYQFGYCTLVVMGAQRGAADWPGSDHPATLKYLLSRGAPPNSEDIVGHTALHHAIQHPQGIVLGLVRMLLSSGCNVNHQNRYGDTAIVGAIQDNAVEAADILMEFGADLDIPEAHGVTASFFMVQTGPQIAAVLTRWIRKRNGERRPMDGKKCDGCGKTGGVLKACSRCHTTLYCSAECQRAQWSTHKCICRSFDSQATVTVRPVYEDIGTLYPLADVARRELGIMAEPMPTKSLRTVHEPRMRANQSRHMIVKVQVPYACGGESEESPRIRNGNLLVSTKKRDLVCSVCKEDKVDAYLRLSQTVREKGFARAKACFPAELKNKDELLIKICDVLAKQNF